MTADDRAAVLRAAVGERGNRRHRPGRAFERTAYRFDVLTDTPGRVAAVQAEREQREQQHGYRCFHVGLLF